MAATDTRDPDLIRSRCTRFLTHHYPRSPRETLLALAEAIGEDELPDQYGGGAVLAEFEAQIAELLGKEAAVFMPSGTMAQQIALRICCNRRGIPNVAMHPRNHLDDRELFGYQHLHRLHGIMVGSPDRLLTLDDLTACAEPLGALLLELPQRELGGLLPEWDALVAITGWARERGIALHMDGARLWESAPYYGRDLAEIAALFDTVYVSFYKGLGGLAGSALAGSADVIGEARVWQRRHGGNLIRLYPYVVSARLGLEEKLPKMPVYHERAKELAAALRTVPGIGLVPDPPQTNMMHLYLRGEKEGIERAALDLAEETGIWLFHLVWPTPLPGVQRLELTVGDATLDLPVAEVAALFRRLLERARD
jgi:threonine aldolase